jgi:hypothetical protein
MPYYIRTDFEGGVGGVWRIDESEAIMIGVENAENGPGTHFRANPGEPIFDAIRRQATSWFEGAGGFHQLTLSPGEFYPRMARPSSALPHESPGTNPATRAFADVVAISRAQLVALTTQLERICQTVHPAPETSGTYGHDIRNLLILACTEVETHWRAILLANGQMKRRLTTNDYVALQAAMRLGDYAVAFPHFPWLAPISPFLGWGDTGKPTKGLDWYNAYNAVKHNREGNVREGTLENAMSAVSACVILLCAQFGTIVILPAGSQLASFFHLSGVPNWPFSECYTSPYSDGRGWRPRQFTFLG